MEEERIIPEAIDPKNAELPPGEHNNVFYFIDGKLYKDIAISYYSFDDKKVSSICCSFFLLLLFLCWYFYVAQTINNSYKDEDFILICSHVGYPPQDLRAKVVIYLPFQ